MLSLEIGKPYLTRGAWKAVVFDKDGYDFIIRHEHKNGAYITVCNSNGRHGLKGQNDLISDWIEEKTTADFPQPTLHDMVAMAAITGLCANGFEGTCYQTIANDAHEIARAYCATREKEMY